MYPIALRCRGWLMATWLRCRHCGVTMSAAAQARYAAIVNVIGCYHGDDDVAEVRLLNLLRPFEVLAGQMEVFGLETLLIGTAR
jgi:hypothetical protein